MTSGSSSGLAFIGWPSNALPRRPVDLQSLRSHFRGEVVADMLCYLRLHLELEMLAKGVLLMRRGTGWQPETRTRHARSKFDEPHGTSRRSIGRTGRRAMQPFLHLNARDLWQIHMLSR